VIAERIRHAGAVAWAIVGLAALLTLIGVIGWYFRVIWPPLVLAGAIVFILNPVVTYLQRRHIPRALGTGISYLGVVGITVLAGFLIFPLAQRQADELAEQWPELRADVEERINDLAARSEENDWPIRIPTVEDLEEQFSSNDQTFEEQLDTIREVGLRVFHVALIFILAPIIAFYLLVDLPHLRRVAESLIPEQSKAEVLVVAGRLNRAIGGFFRGQLVVALIVGTMVSIGLAIIDLPFWLLVGMIAGIFNMIPLIGPYIGAIPGIIIALTTRDFGTAVWVVVIMVVAQQIDNHFITPNVMQRVVKLHPAAVMLALLAGGTIAGFFGLLLAVPVAAVLKILGSHLWRTYVLGEPIEEIAAFDQAADAGGGILEEVGDDEDEDGDAAEIEAGVGAGAAGPADSDGSPEPAGAGADA
jgi:predicted PurR-regulated permease PerM